MLVSSVIEEYIDDSDLKEIAKRAIWLGNDETHIVRKWGGGGGGGKFKVFK
jgi:hypothetical protein